MSKKDEKKLPEGAVAAAASCSAARERLLYLDSDKGSVYARASAIRWIRPHGTDPNKCWIGLGRGGDEPTSPEICIHDSPDSLRHRVEMREEMDSQNETSSATGGAQPTLKS